jgi:F-type H+-transporting ATPase subunit delta
MLTSTASSKIARRYAKALLAQALLQQHLDWVCWDLGQLKTLFQNEMRLTVFFSQTTRSLEEKLQFAQAHLFQDACPLTQRFLKLLLQNKRMDVLLSVVEAFEREVAQHKGVGTVKVTSVLPLDEELKQRLSGVLKKRFALNEVLLHCEQDASLLGGLLLQFEDTQVDCSLRSQLNALQDVFTTAVLPVNSII